jgi:hypothetical protein
MCIIIDASIASELPRQTDAAKPVLDRLNKGKLLIVTGGEAKRELIKANIKFYRELMVSGRVREFDARTIEQAWYRFTNSHPTTDTLSL